MVLNIGELARRTGVSIRSLRYYEVKQLLTPQRGENRYRFYDHTAVERVKTIQFYLSLGLTTNEIFDILCEDDLSFCDGSIEACPEEEGLYKKKLLEIDIKIASLEQARTYLRERLARVQAAVPV